MWRRFALPGALAVTSVVGCGGGKDATPSPPCDQACVDGVTLRAVRETLKLAYNLTLQGNAVGPQEGASPCPGGGSVRVVGEASSNATQGATRVDLTFTFSACAYQRTSGEPDKSYDVILDGVVREQGTLAVQPTATTALLLSSDELEVRGQVYDPPLAIAPGACALTASQSGNDVTGTLCGRPARFSF
ncbi:MAG: hypothetical protein IT374_23990 [Polyangiaceae bacterium]|nr:hypothetical protein [Polyangiaceae bacterium]